MTKKEKRALYMRIYYSNPENLEKKRACARRYARWMREDPIARVEEQVSKQLRLSRNV